MLTQWQHGENMCILPTRATSPAHTEYLTLRRCPLWDLGLNPEGVFWLGYVQQFTEIGSTMEHLEELIFNASEHIMLPSSLSP